MGEKRWDGDHRPRRRAGVEGAAPHLLEGGQSMLLPYFACFSVSS